MNKYVELVCSCWLRFIFYHPLWNYCNGRSKEEIASSILDFKAGTAMPLLLSAPLWVFSWGLGASIDLLLGLLFLYLGLAVMLVVLYFGFEKWSNKQILRLCKWLVKEGGKTSNSELRRSGVVFLHVLVSAAVLMPSIIFHGGGFQN